MARELNTIPKRKPILTILTNRSNMKTIELFSGTKSFSKVANELGHETFTTDNNDGLSPDLFADIRELRASQFPYQPDILWASPPCTAFSVAAIGKNWEIGGIPKTLNAILGQELVKKTIQLIEMNKSNID